MLRENSGSQATCLLCPLLLALPLTVYCWALCCPHKMLSLFLLLCLEFPSSMWLQDSLLRKAGSQIRHPLSRGFPWRMSPTQGHAPYSVFSSVTFHISFSFKIHNFNIITRFVYASTNSLYLCNPLLLRKNIWGQKFKVRDWILASCNYVESVPPCGKFNRKKKSSKGFPGGWDDKESACKARDLGSILGSGRSPGEGNSNPLHYSCLGNWTDREAWQAVVCGVPKSLTQLSD